MEGGRTSTPSTSEKEVFLGKEVPMEEYYSLTLEQKIHNYGLHRKELLKKISTLQEEVENIEKKIVKLAAKKEKGEIQTPKDEQLTEIQKDILATAAEEGL